MAIEGGRVVTLGEMMGEYSASLNITPSDKNAKAISGAERLLRDKLSGMRKKSLIDEIMCLLGYVSDVDDFNPETLATWVDVKHSID